MFQKVDILTSQSVKKFPHGMSIKNYTQIPLEHWSVQCIKKHRIKITLLSALCLIFLPPFSWLYWILLPFSESFFMPIYFFFVLILFSLFLSNHAEEVLLLLINIVKLLLRKICHFFLSVRELLSYWLHLVFLKEIYT